MTGRNSYAEMRGNSTYSEGPESGLGFREPGKSRGSHARRQQEGTVVWPENGGHGWHTDL